MTTLACTVSQKSLTKNFIIQSMERKKIGQIQGRISRRRLVCNPTIQHVLINLYTKYDSSSLQGCGEIFDEKVLRNYGRTDGRTDGMMDRCKPVYPPLFQSGGIKKEIYREKILIDSSCSTKAIVMDSVWTAVLRRNSNPEQDAENGSLAQCPYCPSTRTLAM